MATTKAAPKRAGMEWVKAGRRQFALVRGGKRLGVLEWVKGRATLCAFHARGKTWTFKRSGFIRSVVTIRQAGAETDLAQLVLGLWGNSMALVFRNGRTLRWKGRGFWRAEYGFEDAKGRLAVRLQRKGVTGSKVIATLGAGAKGTEEALLLCGFAFYLLKAAEADAAAATVVGG